MLKPWEIDRRTGTSYKKTGTTKKQYNPANPAMQRAQTGTTNRSTQSSALSRFKDQVGLEAPGILDLPAISQKYLDQVAAADAAKQEPMNPAMQRAVTGPTNDAVAPLSGQPAAQPSSTANDAVAALLSQPAAPAAAPAPYVDPYANARAEAQRAAEARRQFLQQWASGARMTMNQAADNAASVLANQVNPFVNMQMLAPSVVPAVYGTYLQQSGVSPDQVQALIDLSAAEQAANDQARRDMVNVLAGSTDVARDSRVSDVALARALSGLDVDNRLMAAMLGVDEGEAAALARFAELTRQDELAADQRVYDRNQDERQMRIDRVNSFVAAVGDELDPQSIIELYIRAGA